MAHKRKKDNRPHTVGGPTLDPEKKQAEGRGKKKDTQIKGGGEVLHGHSAAKDVFQKAQYALWLMTWKWAKRRHPKKSSKWVKVRYFRCNGGHWTFQERKAELVKPDTTLITRFTKITGRNSPYDPALKEY